MERALKKGTFFIIIERMIIFRKRKDDRHEKETDEAVFDSP